MRFAQQFICKKCTALSGVQRFELSVERIHFVRCEDCGAKNRILQPGLTPSMPGVLQVTGLLDEERAGRGQT
jgi:RNase P subunit RPR2